MFGFVCSLGLICGADDPVAGNPVASKTLLLLHGRVDLETGTKKTSELFRSIAAKVDAPLFVDPRIDAQGTISGKYQNTPLDKVLCDAAVYVGGRMVMIGDVVYIGPAEFADRAAAAAFRARTGAAKFPSPWKESFAKRIDSKWPAEAIAQDLATSLAKDMGIQLSGADELDLALPGGDFTQVTRSDLLSLWSAPSDRTWTFDAAAKKITIEPLPEDARLERTLRGLGPVEAKRRADGYTSQEIASLDVTVKAGTVTLKGDFSALLEADRLDRSTKATQKPAKGTAKGIAKGSGKTSKTFKGKNTPPTKRYKVTYRNVTLESFVDSVNEFVDGVIDIDDQSLEAAGKSRTIIVQCVASGVELDELLRLALEEQGLTFVKTKGRITIKAK